MKRHLYPITSAEYKRVRSLYLKHYYNTAKEILIDLTYEAVILTAGLWIAFSTLKTIMT